VFSRTSSALSQRSESRHAIGIDPNQFAISFRYKRATEIYGENEPAEYIYQITEGAVRSCKILSDGRRHIGAFHLAGDLFGFENGPVHRFTAEAIVDTHVRLIKLSSLEVAAKRDLPLVHDLLKMTASNLEHAEEHMLLLGRKNAIERVAAFLLEMDRRLTNAGFLSLPMNRRDIADYLGLTIETVSRALTCLESQRVLAFLGERQRQIVLLDRKRLSDPDGCASIWPKT
jgi:CRP/FNR family transcriptional regulator, nitrogen fixation regulation protein